MSGNNNTSGEKELFLRFALVVFVGVSVKGPFEVEDDGGGGAVRLIVM